SCSGDDLSLDSFSATGPSYKGGFHTDYKGVSGTQSINWGQHHAAAQAQRQFFNGQKFIHAQITSVHWEKLSNKKGYIAFGGVMQGSVDLRRSTYSPVIGVLASALGFVSGQLGVTTVSQVLRGLKGASSALGGQATSSGMQAGLAFQQGYEICC